MKWMLLSMTVLSSAAVLAKTNGPNVFRAEEIGLARERVRTEPAARQQVERLVQSVRPYLEMSDEELWRFVPPAELRRATFLWQGQGDFPGCPVCGKAVFRAGGGFYPWIMRPDLPWKVTCPNCRTVFPSNDFAAYYAAGMQGEPDMSGEFPDDGSGWVSPDGIRHYFVGHWCQRQRWRDILQAIEELGRIHLLTGDDVYARACTLLLCRVAEIYPHTRYDQQSNYGAQGRILPWCWENTSVVLPLAIAYDSIWPYMRASRDAGLRAFLAGKGIADACAHVDQGFLQDVAQKMIHTNQYLSNEGDHQRAFAVVALVWGDNDPARGITTEAMLDWLARGRGNMEYLVWNDIYADGFPNEASPGYSSAVSAKVWEIAGYMERAGYDLFSSPRLAATAHVWLDLTICGRRQPAIGDYGNILGGGRAGWNAVMFRDAWQRTGDPRFAKALVAMGNPGPGLFAEDTRAAVTRAAAAHPGPLVGGTRNLSQFGCAILESRSPLRPRGLSLYYGSAAGGHGHYDRLNIELHDNGRSVMPDLGYPDQWGARASRFHKNSTSHYVVQIDASGQQTLGRGKLHLLADLDQVQVVEAAAENVYPGLAECYRRTVALVDVSDEAFYVVDLFRVAGGRTHDWLFHGPPQDGLTVDGVALSAPRPGTLAGRELAVGEPAAADRRSGYEWLHQVQEGNPEGAWSVTVPPAADAGGLRMTMLPGCAQSVMIARVDSPRIPGVDLPETLPWIVARNQDRGPSTFAAVIRSLDRHDSVQAIRPLAVRGGGANAVALEVVSADAVDTIYSSLEPETEAQVGDSLRVAARFALIRQRADGEVVSVHAVGARRLLFAGVELTASPELQGSVVATDMERNTVSVAGFPAAAALVGESVLFANERQQTNFQIAAVKDAANGAELGFGRVSLIAGRGEVFDADDASRTLFTDTLWRTHGTQDIWAPGFHPALEGMRLSTPDGAWQAAIAACRLFPDQAKEWWQPEADHGHFQLATAEPLSRVFKPGDRYVVQTVGPGDSVRLPTRVVLQARGTHRYRLLTTCEQLTLRLDGTSASGVLKPLVPGVSSAWVTAQDGAFSLAGSPLDCGELLLILDPEPTVNYADWEPPALAGMTLAGQPLRYVPDMPLAPGAPGELVLTLTDANPMLPPEVVCAGIPLTALSVSQRALAAGRHELTVQLPLPRTLDHAAVESEYPPLLEVRVWDKALNPEPCRLRFALSGILAPTAEAVFLSDLEAVSATAHGGLKRDSDYYGDAGLDLRGEHVAKGIMICPTAGGRSEVIYDLSALPAQRFFRALVGVEDHAGMVGSVTFEVHVEGPDGEWQRLHRTGIIRGQGDVRALNLDLGATSRLRLLCTDAGDSHNSDHAAWANARLETQ